MFTQFHKKHTTTTTNDFISLSSPRQLSTVLFIFSIICRLCQLADQRIYSGWKQNKWFSNVLGEESRVAEHRNVLTERVRKVLNEKRESCLLDALLAYEGLSRDDVESTVSGFIVLGYDRLASTVCSAMMQLAMSEATQEQLHRDPTSLENFLLETQRLYPAITVISKWISEGVALNGYFIPPNTSTLLYLHGTGRDVHRFQSPDQFDMNRKNLAETFGASRHETNVPMTVMKALLGNLVRKYQLRMGKDDIRIDSGLTLRTNAIRVNVKSR